MLAVCVYHLQEENELSERLAELEGREKALRAQMHNSEGTVHGTNLNGVSKLAG